MKYYGYEAKQKNWKPGKKKVNNEMKVLEVETI